MSQKRTGQDVAAAPTKVGAMRVVHTGMTESQERDWLASHEKYLQFVNRPRSTDWPEHLKIWESMGEAMKLQRLEDRLKWMEKRREEYRQSCDRLCRFKHVVGYVFKKDEVVDLGKVKDASGAKRYFTRDEIIKIGNLVQCGPGGLQWDPDATDEEIDTWNARIEFLKEQQLAEQRRAAQQAAYGR